MIISTNEGIRQGYSDVRGKQAILSPPVVSAFQGPVPVGEDKQADRMEKTSKVVTVQPDGVVIEVERSFALISFEGQAFELFEAEQYYGRENKKSKNLLTYRSAANPTSVSNLVLDRNRSPLLVYAAPSNYVRWYALVPPVRYLPPM